MWYFAWILGLPLAVCFAALNAMWFEMLEGNDNSASHPAPPAMTHSKSKGTK